MGLHRGSAVAARAMAGLLLCLFSGKVLAQTADTILNWAAARQGGVASSSALTGPALIAINDGDHGGASSTAGPGATLKTGDWAQITFAQPQTIDAVTVYSQQDASVPVADPSEDLTFAQSGLVAFSVQVLQNGAWTTVASIDHNTLVKRAVSFAPVTASAVRVVCTRATTSGAGLVELEAWGAIGISNIALQAANAVPTDNAAPATTISATSSYGVLFPASALVDGVTSGAHWGTGTDGGWSNASDDPFPNQVELAFATPKVIHAITLWTLQDDYATADPPTDSTYFSQWGLTGFEVQVWRDGWVTVAQVTGNNLVKRTITFEPTAAMRVRIVCTSGLQGYARLTELQAWGVELADIPHLTGLTPRHGAPGDTVTIKGDHFSAIGVADHVFFNGVEGQVTAATPTQLSVTIPSAATTGRLSLTVNRYTQTTPIDFVIDVPSPAPTSVPGPSLRSGQSVSFAADAAGPAIDSFSPNSGPPTTVVTILGSGFDPNPINNTVTFNTTQAQVTSASTTSLTVVAPYGSSGFIQVSVNGQSTTSMGRYTFPPRISSFTPTSGPTENTVVTVQGSDVAWAAINFTGGASAAFYSTDGYNDMVYVPTAAQTGPITATNWSLTSAPSSQSFTVTHPAPTITGFTPTHGKPGSTVTVSGTNFSPTATNTVVTINGVPATISSPRGTTVNITVPTTATTGKITVTRDGQTATSTAVFTVDPLAVQSAAFVAQTVPATMIAGATYPVSVTMQNTGSTTWTAGQQYKLGSQNGVDWGVGQRVIVPSDVAFGQQVTFTFTVTAPATPGSYNFVWQMLQEGVGWFGDIAPAVAVTVTPVTLAVNSINPPSASVGQSVAISGAGFSSTTTSNTVKFAGSSTAATVTAASGNSLTVTIPADASAGPITITVGGQSVTTSDFYLVPVFRDFTPTQGPTGTSVTINGTGFGASQGTSVIAIGGMIMSVSSWTSTRIVATIPNGASTNPFSIRDGTNHLYSSSASFSVAPPVPTISSLSVTHGMVGDSVIFTGTNFSTAAGGNVVTFNGVASTAVTSMTSTKLTATVPLGATSGPVGVSVGISTGTGPSFTIDATPAATCTSAAPQSPSAPTNAATQRIFAYGVQNATNVQFPTWWVGENNANDLQWLPGINAGGGTWYVDVPHAQYDPGNPRYGQFITRVWMTNPAYNSGALQKCGVDAWWTWQAPLTITGISPASASIGQSVVIGGSGFDATATNNVVRFSGTGVNAQVTTVTPTQLTVVVPPNATSGAITVTVGSNTVTTTSAFFTLVPVLNGFTPTTGPPGQPVIITGSGFGAAQVSGFTYAGIGASALTITSWSDTQIVGTVAKGATTAAITVRTAENKTLTGGTFTVTTPVPVITGVSPNSGSVGALVRIDGANFSAAANGNVVKFNGAAAGTLSNVSDAHLTVAVPAGASTGPITVTVGTNTATSPSNFTVPTQAAAFVSQTVPTTMMAGQSYPVSVTMQNTGSATWTAAQNYKLDAQNPQDNSLWGVSRVTVPNDVPSGQNVTFTFTVTAPTTTGTYNFQWGMLQEGVAAFGAFTDNVSVTVNPVTLSITGITPTQASVGDSIVINGTGFVSGSNQVLFGGSATPATITAASATAITVTVPGGIARSAPIAVTVGSQSATTPSFYLVPTFKDFSPAKGPNGTHVTITGTGFGTTQSTQEVVGINGRALVITSWSDTQIVGTIPNAVGTGSLIFQDATAHQYTIGTFAVTLPPPTITRFTPTRAWGGSTVTIQGTNFDPDSTQDAVTFNGVAAPILSVDAASPSSSRLTVTVPSSLALGTATVVVAVGGNASAPSSGFTVIEKPLDLDAQPALVNIDSQVTPGNAAHVQISMTNVGATTWTTDGSFQLQLLDAPGWSPTFITVPTQTAYGETASFNYLLSSPVTPGTYTLHWRMMRNVSGTLQPFGAMTPNAVIQVAPADSGGTGFGYPSTLSCASTAPPIDPGTNPGLAGLWWNPKRYGTGWEFNFTATGMVATWMTYDNLRRPTWLSNGGAVTAAQVDASGARQYLLPLYQITRLVGATSFSKQQVGQVAVTFKPGSAVSAAVRWQWDAVGSQAQADECVYDFWHAPDGARPPGTQGTAVSVTKGAAPTARPSAAQATTATSGNPLNESYTGAWYSPGQSGWGYMTSLGAFDGGGLLEVTALTIFDTQGYPVWVQGTNRAPLDTAQDLQLDYPKSSATGYPNGYPTVDCASASCVIVNASVGTLTRSYSSTQVGSSTATVTVPTSITGGAAVAWPNAPITNPATLQKLSDVITVLVDKTQCAIPNGAMTCEVAVSWATTDDHLTARLYRRDLVTGVLNTAPLTTDTTSGHCLGATYSTSPANGACPDVLGPGADVQYELREGSANGRLLFTSAEVIVPTPNPPASVTAIAPAAGSGAVPLSWVAATAGPAAEAYQIQYATSLSGPWTTVPGRVTGTSTTVTLGVGSYYFAVAACNRWGCSAVTTTTTPISVTGTGASPPNPPASATATAPASGSNNVPVSWQPSAAGPTATSYAIEYATSAAGPWTAAAGSFTGSSATVTVNAAAGTYAFLFGVAACNAAGCSAYTLTTQPVSVTVSGSTPSPVLPTSVTPIDDTVAHDPTVGTMAGQAGTDGGAAQYHVPIVVPPGRAGMQPDLALVYNSRSGNGVMGMGWTISGLSSIHRCPQTPEQDGQTLGVAYADTDRLCLDGQRLVAVNGTYGTSGAEYRTEVDSYARITQIGGDISGGDTACFRVEQKNGRILHYGGVTNGSSCSILSNSNPSKAPSRVKPSGAPAALSWLVEKIEDRLGNYQSYTYTDKGNGEVLLSKVTYTGYNATDGDRSVSFEYQPRINAVSAVNGLAVPTDISSSYLFGGLTMQTQALQSITTAVGGTTVRTYTPTYTTSSYSQRLQMMSLTECASGSSGTACHPATQFTYSDGALQYPLTSLNNLGFPQFDSGQPSDFHTIGDLDGDGAREAVFWVSLSDGLHILLAQTTADRQIRSVVDLTQTGFGLDARAFTDIDSDGRTEAILTPQQPPGSTTPISGVVSFGVWKGARGQAANCIIAPSTCSIPATATPQSNFDTLFQTVTSNIPWVSGSDVYAYDMNGDGKMDIVVVGGAGSADCPTSQAVLVYLNDMGSGVLGSAAQPTAHFVIPAHPLFCLGYSYGAPSGANIIQHIEHIADFDGDGLPDFFITTEISAATVVTGTHFDGVQLTRLNGTALSSKFMSCTAIGLTDTPTTPETDDCTWTRNVAAGGGGGGTSYSVFARWIDINGDGLEDFVIARATQSNGPTWRVALNRGNATMSAEINTGSGVGLDVTRGADNAAIGFRYVGRLPNMDVDGDGKPDLLVPSVSHPGGAFASYTCVMGQLTASSGKCPKGEGGLKGTCTAYWCPEAPGASNISSSLPFDPVFKAYTTSPALFAVDHSAYYLAYLKFVQTGANQIVVNAIDTSLVSKLNNGNQTQFVSDDLFGDGLPDLITTLGCNYFNGQNQCVTLSSNLKMADGTPWCTRRTGANGCTLDNQIGLYANINQGVSLAGGTQAASSTLESTLPGTPVSGGANPILPQPGLPGLLQQSTNGLGESAQWLYWTLSSAAAVSRDGVAGYQTSSANGYVDSRHYYFASSMPVVSAMLQSNGIGDITGSRSAIYGYSEAMYNHLGRGFQGFRTITTENVASDASQRLITTTSFKQKFPLVGKVESVVTRTPGSASHTIHSETANYACLQSGTGSTASTTICPQDGASAPALPDKTGGIVYQPVPTSQTSKDYDLASGAQSGHSATSNSQWDIYGNLLSQTVTRGDDAAGGQFVASHTVSTTNTYTPNASSWTLDLPDETQVQTSISYTRGVPDGVTAPPTQTLDTKFVWNPDRTPQSKTVQPQSVIGDANQESTAAYSYPSPNYGLPSQVQVTGPSITPSRTTSYGYSSDGYFVATTTNGLNQTVTTVVQARDGQVTKATDPNRVSTGTTYDAFGRAIGVTHRTSTGTDIEPPINIAHTNCAGGCEGPGGDSNDVYSIYRTLIAQPGYPTKVAWYDLLGRPLKQAQAGFSSTSGGTPQYAFSATRTWFDENGRTGKQSTPYYVGIDSPSYTEFNYDALGRVTAKSVPAACGGEMDTTYSYVGRQTKIAASGLCPGGVSNATIQMSRSVNVLGQLMQTIDANGKTTSYWTDALGHVAAIQDVEGNVTQATYNALGQRLQSVDPDQGTWNFSYNALGELTSQTDARGVVTTVTVRDALGRMTQRQQMSPTTVTGLAAENLLDAWTYDPLNGVGQLGSVTRRRGGGTPSSNPVTWSESYAYDPAVRPITTATTINESGTTLNLSSATTYDSVGRVDTQTYPQLPTSSMAGLSVKHTYTGYGQLDALSNAGSSYVYWTLQAQNAWGHVTNEQYPGVITGSHSDYASTGQAQTLSWSGSVGDQVVYTYDSFGNLNTQQRSAGGSTNTESYLYDSLQRLTNAKRAIGSAVSYSYSANGNITSKNDNGTGSYSYPPVNGRSNGCGPHAAISANGLSYTCDANGNVIGGAISATYDANNHPRSINRGSGAMSWSYSATGAMTSEVSSRGLRYFGPNGYEQIATGSSATQVHELGPVIVTRTGGVDSVSVVLRDRLGSTISVIDANAPTTRWYDAFGKVRKGDMTDKPPGTLNLNETIHGFTKHDHADDVQLIHMGGRVYDYSLGRFLNVDPIIGGTGSQALNPYSYIGNNPLSGKDPTGYQCEAGTQMASDNSGCVSTATAMAGGSAAYVSSGGSQGAADRLQSAVVGLSNKFANSLAAGGNGAAGGQGSQVLQTNLGNPALQSCMANTPSTPMAQPTVGPDNRYWLYDEWSQGNWFERGIAGIANAAGNAVGSFMSDDQFGGSHNVISGQSILPGDAKIERLTTIGMLGFSADAKLAAASARTTLLPAIETMATDVAKTIDTALVRFTQSSVRSTFSDERTLESTINALRGPSGDAVAQAIPPIRIFEDNGVLRTLDNRRLLAFSQANREVPYVWAKPSEVANESWKFSATPGQADGWYIRVKP